jgi:hypothetical protein
LGPDIAGCGEVGQGRVFLWCDLFVFYGICSLTRSLGRPKNRWEDDVKTDITKMKITNWKNCIKNRSKWKEFVGKARTSPKL